MATEPQKQRSDFANRLRAWWLRVASVPLADRLRQSVVGRFIGKAFQDSFRSVVVGFLIFVMGLIGSRWLSREDIKRWFDNPRVTYVVQGRVQWEPQTAQLLPVPKARVGVEGHREHAFTDAAGQFRLEVRFRKKKDFIPLVASKQGVGFDHVDVAVPLPKTKANRTIADIKMRLREVPIVTRKPFQLPNIPKY